MGVPLLARPAVAAKRQFALLDEPAVALGAHFIETIAFASEEA